MQHSWAKSLWLLFFATSLSAAEGGEIMVSFSQMADNSIVCDSLEVDSKSKPLKLNFISYPFLSTPDKVAIPTIKQGFFCRFEDKLQIKYKIPINFGVE